MSHSLSDDSEDSHLEHIASELKGNTLIIYWFMLRNNCPHSAREIQRRVKLSSSSLALHHLNKLIDLKLVKRNGDGLYIVAQSIRPGLLSFFAGSGRLFVPRFTFYAVFNSLLLISSTYLFWNHLDAASIILLISLSVSSAVFWLESFRLWRIQPL